MSLRFQRSRPTRGGTVRRQTTPANRDHLYPDSLMLVSASGQFAAAELILISTTSRYDDDRSEPNSCSFRWWATYIQIQALLQVPLSCMYRNVTSRGVSHQCNICSGWVHAQCSVLLNATHYRRSKDWTCDPCSASNTSITTPTPAPSAEQISDDSTFNSSTLMELATNLQN